MSKQHLCPICKVPVCKQEEHFPFCSQRCQTIDLARWADGSYHIPGEPIPDTDDDSYSIH